MVQIANPIYDVVFKYMMNDEKVARLLLSAIIGRQVVSLDFLPTEHQLKFSETLTVFRMDFTARIQDENGNQQLIIIELQKAQLASDIMRFRRYLGEQYAKGENMAKEDSPEQQLRKALPILSIYFLGHKLKNIKAPVIRVNRVYTDAATGEIIKEREEFVESLTHDSIIIQIPYLVGHRRTELELLLALFDQQKHTSDKHFLLIEEGKLPERYNPVVRRLQNAMADVKVRQTMEAEDDIIEEFKVYQRIIEAKDRLIESKERVMQSKERKIVESEKVIETMDRQLEENEKLIEVRDRKLEENEKLIEVRDRKLEENEQLIENQRKLLEAAILRLHAAGIPVEELAVTFGKGVSDVNALLARQGMAL